MKKTNTDLRVEVAEVIPAEPGVSAVWVEGPRGGLTDVHTAPPLQGTSYDVLPTWYVEKPQNPQTVIHLCGVHCSDGRAPELGSVIMLLFAAVYLRKANITNIM